MSTNEQASDDGRELLLHRMLWTARGYRWRLVPHAPPPTTKKRARRKRPGTGQQAAR